jgi:hypothetical protein
VKERWAGSRAARRSASRRGHGPRRRTRSWWPSSCPTATAAGGSSPSLQVHPSNGSKIGCLMHLPCLSSSGVAGFAECSHHICCRAQGCSGAGRAAGCGGPTTSGPTSSVASSPRRRRRWSSTSTRSSAAGSFVRYDVMCHSLTDAYARGSRRPLPSSSNAKLTARRRSFRSVQVVQDRG